ncbi:phage tail sheath family protein [Burkholderiaceae bacterium UC74_6]
MALSYKYPAVYIEEQAATGPIEGVGTSTPALLGPALDGPVGVPMKITNWTQYKAIFGEFSVAPRLYLPHAVRGFFENGGTVAYVVRVGTASRAAWTLLDRGAVPAPTLYAEALKEGVEGNNITIAVQNAAPGLVAGVNVLKGRAALKAGPATSVITLAAAADAAKFRVDDVVTVAGGATRYSIVRIAGDQITLSSAVATPVALNDIIRIADLAVGQKRFRVDKTDGIEPGSSLSLTQAGGNTENALVEKLQADAVVLASGLSKAYTLDQADAATVIASYEFTLVVKKPLNATETFAQLSMDPRHSRYFARAVNSAWISVAQPPAPSVQAPPLNQPAVIGDTAALPQGVNDNPAAVGLNHYQVALTALEKLEDVNMVCVPGRVDSGVQAAVVAHCENMADRFAILDGDGSVKPPIMPGSALLAQRAAVLSARGYAALYYPWIWINDPSSRSGDELLLVPPSGHLAGIYARSDSQRGVHKAPANEYITGAADLGALLSNADQGEINIEGINVLRIFPGQRPIVWGARTTAPKDEVPWRYINVRRLFLFVEKSIQRGIRWALFEPNDQVLWKKLDRTITEFLTRVWRSGALFGKTASEAFYVKVDEELNPASVRALGQVIVEVGIAPVRPAEFVVVRIAMWDSGSESSES